MSEPVVDIEQGTLKGCEAVDYHGGPFLKFLGIPYAEAPVGELRFKAPVPPKPWTGVRDATKEGPECPSGDMYFTYYIGNEDNCLNLNIYTKSLPKPNETKNAPVMVWVHGGAFTTGCNKADFYGPGYLMTQDIVLVAINYRLGILGFASFKDKSLDVPGNAGLKDMRLALKWVKKNIDKFGGDPDNVTIFGESAGAAAVHYLTLSPTTEGLFHKAIIQSGSALNNWSWGKNNSTEIAKCMGYKETDEKTILQRLRKESAKSIVAGQKKMKENFLPSCIRPWGPVVEPPSEHAFLTESPVQIMHRQGSRKIPMIIGYNSKEGFLFELVRRQYSGVSLPEKFELELPYELELDHEHEKTKELAEKVKKHYFGEDVCNEDNIDQVYLLKGDVNFIHGIQRMIKLQAKHSDQPVYAYRMSLMSDLNYFSTFALSKNFTWTIFVTFMSKVSPVMRNYFKHHLKNMPKKQIHGVGHADDLFHLFHTFFTPTIEKGSQEDLYIQRFVKMWTNFAKYGDPTPHDNDEILNSIKWTQFNPEEKHFLDIGHDLKMTGDVDRERMQLWDEIYETHLKI
ncbi:hypothetical protein GWI33_005385 [Rhynchophorus ferrugineus]|uniref:Carboxylic ester hydrolase n=1 Tax=Rhynchophorus ferrugineus TaxID=354439 RepID=A0A834MJN4_RHYFE|nr:hypothetical protein GWI33_005385 [Rhynchophorus ferrugineus]